MLCKAVNICLMGLCWMSASTPCHPAGTRVGDDSSRVPGGSNRESVLESWPELRPLAKSHCVHCGEATRLVCNLTKPPRPLWSVPCQTRQSPNPPAKCCAVPGSEGCEGTRPEYNLLSGEEATSRYAVEMWRLSVSAQRQRLQVSALSFVVKMAMPR